VLNKLADELRRFKNMGFSDAQLAFYAGLSEDRLRAARLALDVRPVYQAVDACAGRVPARSPYYYSTYQSREEEARPGQRDRVVIIGNGPNRIGQGLEFDYCCVHAAYALRELGYDAVMINSNPETVSTDYDTSSRLYFEPLTFEDVMNVIEIEKPLGVIIQFGGQTPLNLSQRLAEAGVKILGTSPESIDQAEDRERFTAVIRELGLSQPEHGNAHTLDEARAIAGRLGYPVLVRPSYVLGGRNMRIIHSEQDLADYVRAAESFSEKHPLLIDKFLDEALELDVDALSDGWETVIGGIIEQIEEGGIHSGDSAGLIPPNSLGSHQLEEIRRATRALARSLKVVGLMNIQFAVKGRTVYVLEVNPRASRTAPFVSKATGLPLPALATKVLMGSRLADLGVKEVEPPCVAVKESVFSFDRFPGVDPILGPEMRSTGEVMGLDPSYGLAIGKAFLAAGTSLPTSGRVFLSVRDDDKPLAARVARQLADLGFTLMATPGTASFLRGSGLTVENVNKVSAGRPNALDHLKNSHLQLVINTTMGRQTVLDSESIRRTAILCKVPIITTMAGAAAAAEAIAELKQGGVTVRSLQDYYKG
jgi:carbamoyl-phosphate synthase large subunit